MTAPTGASPVPITLSPTEHEQIARVFENGPSLFSLLSTIRTRRFGLGYQSETGEEEMQAWSTHQPIRQREGPLAYSSVHQPVPLTEVEEALLAWAALGPNGIVAADIPVQGDLSSLIHWAGRTVPGSSNDFSVNLFIINDSGVHLYRPGTERMAPVEITGPRRLLEDPPLVSKRTGEGERQASGRWLVHGASWHAQREHNGCAPIQRKPAREHVVPAGR